MTDYTLWLSGYFPESGYRQEKVITLHNCPLAYDHIKLIANDILKNTKMALNKCWHPYYGIERYNSYSVYFTDMTVNESINELIQFLMKPMFRATSTENLKRCRLIYNLPCEFEVHTWKNVYKDRTYLFFRSKKDIVNKLRFFFKEYVDNPRIRIYQSMKSDDVCYIKIPEGVLLDTGYGLFDNNLQIILTDEKPWKKYDFTFTKYKGNKKHEIEFINVEL